MIPDGIPPLFVLFVASIWLVGGVLQLRAAMGSKGFDFLPLVRRENVALRVAYGCLMILLAVVVGAVALADLFIR